MKYMTFPSSCSYAGLANMLEQYGVDTSDRSIALAMRLPYLFAYHDGVYTSGPMLQTAEWFHLYLAPIGFQMVEKSIPSAEAEAYLKNQKTAMLGITMEHAGKHAVVYIGFRNHQLVFLNNKWENEETPDLLYLTADELKRRTDAEVMIATLQQIPPQNVRFSDKLETSIAVLNSNLCDILDLCHREETVAALRSRLNTLFRPLFLDGISMLQLIGETELSAVFADLQQELLTALRQESGQMIHLNDYLSTDRLSKAVKEYIELIKAAFIRESSK